ncbi:ABC transporter ATP-binding protein [Urechidicola vernalis]|uniref:ABC transporter ATP-binding protein n=1 Tax=Urechidicola vernalis TaxID=3075600 RepID=A0ABU2Y6Q7_9FLAO|nr:ABC transporter ATP-binding protein [Urechidicola sp. P050]MDT0553879.1 ABC transporter ATP-binding protein [Urechidicola sp. P050]
MTEINQHIALETTNLSIGYPSKKNVQTILQNLNLTFEKGSFTCILGKNGAGKSTLLRTIAKIQPPLNGTIILDNKNLENYSTTEFSKKISLVLTEKLPESNLTVFELIALGRQPYTNWVDKLRIEDENQIKKAMELTQISQLSSKKSYELSDGQFQRVLIARALAQDTDIIIFDEPTAHLDIHHTLETFKLLQSLSENEGKTIIVTTHQIQLAIQSAKQLFLISNEEIIHGTPKELIATKSIEKLFETDAVQFDYIKEQFILKR